MRTEPFRVSRLSLAYLAVAQYLRAYGWFAAIVPTFGLVCLVFGSGVMTAIGLMALLWPLSLPARAILATSKTGRLLEKGAWASLEGDVLYLHGEEGGGMKLGLPSVRRTLWHRSFFVLVLARGDFVGLPLGDRGSPFAAAVEARLAAIRNIAPSTTDDTEIDGRPKKTGSIRRKLL